LSLIVEAWPTLPVAMRSAILTLASAGQQTDKR
jgi:hypothetical protein